MKRSALIMLTIALVLSFSAAQAQSAATNVNVPFGFWVNGQLMPSGHYELSQVGDRATLIANANGHKILGLFNHCRSQKMQNPKLVFQKVDDRYFLSQVWMHQSENGLEVPPSRLQQELRTWYAQVPAGAETVVIALR